MEKVYRLTNKQIFGVQMWPIIMILCSVFIIWSYEGSVGSIVIAILASGVSWWMTGKTPISIIFREGGFILFKFSSKKTGIFVQDILSISEDSYYREIKLYHKDGMIAIKREMPNIIDFIETVQRSNHAIYVDLKHTGKKQPSQ
jgi:hypothetical protein